MRQYHLPAQNIEIKDRVLFKSPPLVINEGDVIGIIGKNGSGKSTLLASIAKICEKQGLISVLSTFSNLADIGNSGGETVMDKMVSTLKETNCLYLLDEPTTYLDVNNIANLIALIERNHGTFCIVSHDRDLLRRICNKIWAIEKGQLTEYEGNYDQYQDQLLIRQQEYQADLKKYHQETKRLKQTIQAQYEEQERKSKKPRKLSPSEYRITGMKTKLAVKNKKSHKARLQLVDRLQAMDKPEPVTEQYDVSFLTYSQKNINRTLYIPPKKCTVQGKVLWDLPGLTLMSGQKLAITGNNGTGKTSYLNYVNSIIPSHYRKGYFQQQNSDSQDDDRTLYQMVRDVSSLSQHELRTMMAVLNFKTYNIETRVNQLSSGERAKCHLLCLLIQDLDVLLVDEATNFLDIKALEALEHILKKFPGILLFVSHDKTFVSALATSELSLDHQVLSSSRIDSCEHETRNKRSGRKDELTILEFRISSLLSQLSVNPNAELEEEYQKLLAERNKLSKLR